MFDEMNRTLFRYTLQSAVPAKDGFKAILGEIADSSEQWGDYRGVPAVASFHEANGGHPIAGFLRVSEMDSVPRLMLTPALNKDLVIDLYSVDNNNIVHWDFDQVEYKVS